MAKKRTAPMPFNVDDYTADTARLTTLQHGAYMLLIMEYWRSGPLPDDDAALASVTKTDRREWARVGPILRQFFRRGDDGLLYQKRADEERARRTRVSKQRSAAAHASHSSGTSQSPSKTQKSAENSHPNDAIAVQMQSNCRAIAPANASPSLPSPSLAPSLSLPPTPPLTIPTTLPTTSLSPCARPGFGHGPLQCETKIGRKPIPGPPGFDDEFWPVYPRKDDKGHARKAYETAMRKADIATIVSGLKGYQFSDDPRFIPLAATWLNGERWLQATENDGINPTLKAAGVTQADLDVFMADGSADVFFGRRT